MSELSSIEKQVWCRVWELQRRNPMKAEYIELCKEFNYPPANESELKFFLNAPIQTILDVKDLRTEHLRTNYDSRLKARKQYCKIIINTISAWLIYNGSK